MKLQGWIYVANDEYDSSEAALAAVRALGAELKEKLNAGAFAGYSAVVLTDPEDFEEYDIDQNEVDRVSHGRLPTIHLNITYDLDIHRVDDPEIAELLSGAGMVHVITDPVAD